jgi:hypothetical protein
MGTVTLNEVNRETLFAQTGVIPANVIYTTFIRDAVNATQYAMLFRPTSPNESNERAFRQFVEDTLHALLQVDITKKGDGRKGYVSVLARETNQEVKGGFAHILLDTLTRVGYLNISKEELEQLKLDSEDANAIIQMLLLARELGKKYVNPRLFRKRAHRVNFDSDGFSTEELVKLANLVREQVRLSFDQSSE